MSTLLTPSFGVSLNERWDERWQISVLSGVGNDF